MPDPVPGATGGLEVVAVDQMVEGVRPDAKARLLASLRLDEVEVQRSYIELLRSQAQLEAIQVTPDVLVRHLQALQQIGLYDPQVLGQSRMVRTASGEDVIEPGHRDDPSLVGQSTQLEQDRYLVEHFKYVSRLGINWKWPNHRTIWDEAVKVLERMLAEEQESYELWRQDRVTYGEAGPDEPDTVGKSGALRKGREDQICTKYANEIRTIIRDTISAFQAVETPPRITSD